MVQVVFVMLLSLNMALKHIANEIYLLFLASRIMFCKLFVFMLIHIYPCL